MPLKDGEIITLDYEGRTDGILFDTTIEKVAEYKPERIALYSYAHVPWVSKSQRGYDESNLPAPEEKLSFYRILGVLLGAAGACLLTLDGFSVNSAKDADFNFYKNTIRLTCNN